MSFWFNARAAGLAVLSLAALGFIDANVAAQDAAQPDADFTDCAAGCPVMVIIPAGSFMLGAADSDPDRRSTEGPQHAVTVARFALSRFEVTFDEWDACVAAGACPRVTDRWGRGTMPVINVSWEDAGHYVRWLARLTGKPYRLATEAEWEYAARAGASTRYSWGDDAATGSANCDGCGGAPGRLQTLPAGSFEPNAFGLRDMLGNVWEWVEDCWHETYAGAPGDGTAWCGGGDPSFRVIRGGSWHNESELARVATRFPRNIHVRFDTLGFRVARTE